MEENRELTAREIWRRKNSSAQDGDHGVYYGGRPPEKKGFNKPLAVTGIILAALFVIGIIMALVLPERSSSEYTRAAESIHGDHIGVLYIEGTISEDDSSYNHRYVLDSLEGMMSNSSNKGLMLYVNTPGGGVYESDEVYLKIREYQDVTGRPVYVYMGSQATSGGYYISAAADRITANRNCWTGSIGVTMGTLFDISGLLERYGIKTETITSGDNKSMGSMTEELTDEQRQIMQSMIDEAYDQFVSIVAEGRGLKEEYVRSISDGRIYTAGQAAELGLVDQVVLDLDEAMGEMMAEYYLEGCSVYDFRYENDEGMLGGLINSVERLAEATSGSGDIRALTELMEKNDELPLEYMCEVMK